MCVYVYIMCMMCVCIYITYIQATCVIFNIFTSEKIILYGNIVRPSFKSTLCKNVRCKYTRGRHCPAEGQNESYSRRSFMNHVYCLVSHHNSWNILYSKFVNKSTFWLEFRMLKIRNDNNNNNFKKSHICIEYC